MLKRLLIFVVLICWYNISYSQDSSSFYITKGKGFEFHFFENKYLLQIDFRGQFRGTYISDKFPNLGDEFDEENTNLGINRARIKIGGHVLKPYYKFYFEQDIKGGNLLDFRVMIEKYSFLKLKVGQWKARFSRERIISSGKQQGLDRSLINSIFTIDRQQGISLYGNLNRNKAVNFNYWASVLAGTGRGGETNDNNSLMYLIRLQWNMNGEVLGFTGSDLEYHENLVSSIAVAGVTNTSKYTQFSTNGGGQLPGFDQGIEGQYKVDQLLFETAFKFKGISWQQEFHFKEIDDRVNIEQTTLIGNYVQLGYFFHHAFSSFPKALEVFGRQAFYDPDIDISSNNTYEYTIGCNWFFKGHKNKLTLEYSYFQGNELDQVVFKENKVRLQWDISIF